MAKYIRCIAEVSFLSPSAFSHLSTLFSGQFLFLFICYYSQSPPEIWRLDTSKPSNRSMKSLFHGMSNFTLDISQWDVSGVTDFVSNIIIV